MYEIALTVASCLRAGTQVHVAWLVGAEGFAPADLERADWSDATALTPGGGRTGSVLSGALDGRIADAVTGLGEHGRLLDVEVTDVDALIAGLTQGGRAEVVVVPAELLPTELWPLLEDRAPVGLLSRLDGDRVVAVELFTGDTIVAAGDEAAALLASGTSGSVRTGDAIVTVLHPVPGLVVFGPGAIARALAEAAALLGWRVQPVIDVPTAKGLLARCSRIDSVVVIGHDVETSGSVLEAALAGPVGYVGALGSRRTQEARADWLGYRGVTDLSRIHGPAGLDIGARTPAEIAVAILAEALAAHRDERTDRPSATAGTA